MIDFLPNKTVSLTIKDDYHLGDFIKTLLSNGFTVSQSESSKEGCVRIYISSNATNRTESLNEEIC